MNIFKQKEMKQFNKKYNNKINKINKNFKK